MNAIIQAILILTLLVTGTSTSTTKSFIASGPSMSPTINHGDRMIVDTSSDLDIERADLVIVAANDKQYVKRVVGVAGDVIEKTTRDSITIHDKKYESVIWGDVQYPIHLAEDEFFVLGDNLNNSLDSRSFGVVTREQIVGKVISIEQ